MRIQKAVSAIFNLGMLSFFLTFIFALLCPTYINFDIAGVHPSIITFCTALMLLGISFIMQYAIYRENVSEIFIGLCMFLAGSSFLYMTYTLAQNPQANIIPFAALFFVAIILGIAAAFVT